MKNFLKQFLLEEKGATSVLIIFMMIVLITLGAFAITSAQVNYRFSQRALDWNRSFYSLDAQAEQFVMEIDSSILAAQNQAISYITNKEFEEKSNAVIPDLLQSEIYEIWTEAGNTSALLHITLDKIFEYHLLNNLMNGTNSDTNISEDNGNFIIHSEITSTINPENHLNVSLEITGLSKRIQLENNLDSLSFVLTRPRYKILQWQQQTPIQMETKDIEKELFDPSPLLNK